MRTRIGLVSALLGTAAAAALAASAAVMCVQIRQAEVRDTPSFLGSVVTTLPYGDKVTVEQQNGAWYRVTKTGGTAAGWLHASALTKKTIVMSSGEAAKTAASSGEMALAGKGFNADVEKEFKANHKDVSFAPVDKMESYKVTPSAVQAFARDGGLRAGERGAK